MHSSYFFIHTKLHQYKHSKLNLSPCSYTGLSKHSQAFICPDKLGQTDHVWWPVPDTLMKNSLLLPCFIYACFLYSSYLDILAATLRLRSLNLHPISGLEEPISVTVFQVGFSLYTLLVYVKKSIVIPHLHSTQSESPETPDSEKQPQSLFKILKLHRQEKLFGQHRVLNFH